VEARFRQENFNFWNLLTESLKIFKIGMPMFLFLAMFILLPWAVYKFFALNAVDQTWYLLTIDTEKITITYDWLQILVIFVPAVFALIAEAYLVETIVKGQAASITDALHYASGRLLQVLLINIVLVIMIELASIIWRLLEILLSVYLLFMEPIIALRNHGWRAFRYSIDLVSGQGWKIYTLLYVISIISGGISWIWIVPIQMSGQGIHSSSQALVMESFIFLSFVIVAMLAYIPIVVYFLNQDYLFPPRRRGWADDVPQK
jgi:hypothetical protein